MKRVFLFLLLVSIISSNLIAQSKSSYKIPLLGETAPSFTAETTEGTLNFPVDYGSKWKILFSHPRDFTPVCSSELLEMAQLQTDFEKLGVKLVVISTDELDQHKAWKKALEDITYKNRKPLKISFPLVDDNSKQVSRQYGMIHDVTSSTKDVRGVFIINPDNKIEMISFYPMNIGRNMEEIKRTVIALQAAGTGKNHLVTPANWQPGEDLLVPQFPYTEKQLSENPKIKDDFYSVSTFMWFKKAESGVKAQ
jgi:peroxiredoxin (alkyl hydroperoxide reductase subunit C)